jgi:hypothetical protein
MALISWSRPRLDRPGRRYNGKKRVSTPHTSSDRDNAIRDIADGSYGSLSAGPSGEKTGALLVWPRVHQQARVQTAELYVHCTCLIPASRVSGVDHLKQYDNHVFRRPTSPELMINCAISPRLKSYLTEVRVCL